MVITCKGTELPRLPGRPFVGKYSWRTREESVQNIRQALLKNLPELGRRILGMEAGLMIDERVRDGVYARSAHDFRRWGLGRVMTTDSKFFNRSFIKALIESFPKLELHRFGFMIRWEHLSPEEAREAVRFRIFKHRPDPGNAAALKEMLYGLTNDDFNRFGLGKTINGRGVGQFGNRRLRDILRQVFPELNLIPYHFRIHTYKDIYEAEAAVREILGEKYPELGRLYSEMASYYRAGSRYHPELVKRMKKIVIGITHGEFLEMGFSHLLNRRRFPGFKSSFRQVLTRSFSLLGLTEKDFLRTLRWRSEAEAKENVRRAVYGHKPSIKADYLRLAESRQREEGNDSLLRYRLGILLLAVSTRQLKKWGISLTGQGAAFYFKGSKTRAFELAFPTVGYSALRQEFAERNYRKGESLWVVQQIEQFEEMASGDNELSIEDRQFLEYLASTEFRERLNSMDKRVPRLLWLRLVHINGQKAPQLIQFLK